MTEKMTESTMLNDYSLKRILLGVVVGIGIAAVVGFQALGLTFESKAKDMAKNAANAAVIEALAPICADNFQRAANATKNKSDLLKVNSSEQTSFIVQGGWAKFPGGGSSNGPAVAEACAKLVATAK